MEIIAITNNKGGAGKSTTAHALGTGLHQRGYRTLLVDLDAQGNLSFCMKADRVPTTALEVLTGTATAKEAIIHTEEGDIIPASPSLAGADTIIKEVGKEYRLKEALNPLQNEYDYIILDTPPALGILTVNALTACNSAIIPAQPETFSIQGIGLLNETIKAVKKYTNPAFKVKGILLTRYKGRTNLAKDSRIDLEQVADYLETELYKTPIRETVAVGDAQREQTSIYKHNPKSNASKDYTALIEEILEQNSDKQK